MNGPAVWLHNVRSAYNVGSIFRTADAAGISHMFLTGYTPHPTDRFGRINKDISKTALGAERTLPWSTASSPMRLATLLKHEGRRIVGIEQDTCAISFRAHTHSNTDVFLLGNEVRGLSPQMRALCDVLIEIPMRGTKESLNVSVAAGIVLFGNVQ